MKQTPNFWAKSNQTRSPYRDWVTWTTKQPQLNLSLFLSCMDLVYFPGPWPCFPQLFVPSKNGIHHLALATRGNKKKWNSSEDFPLFLGIALRIPNIFRNSSRCLGTALNSSELPRNHAILDGGHAICTANHGDFFGFCRTTLSRKHQTFGNGTTVSWNGKGKPSPTWTSRIRQVRNELQWLLRFDSQCKVPVGDWWKDGLQWAGLVKNKVWL